MKKRFSKDEIKALKLIWGGVTIAQDEYWESMARLEALAKERLGIDIEIFHGDGEPCGIGDSNREYELLHMPDGKYEEEL